MLKDIPLNIDSKTSKFEQRILALISLNECRKASSLIEKYLTEGNSISNFQILKFILEPSGMTVAHKMAHLGFNFTDPEILRLKGEDRSSLNAVFGHSGCSVAYILAKRNQTFKDPSILSLGSEDRRATVAHAMALKGHKFDDPSILKLSDDKGLTVAHIMTKNGHVFSDPEILELKNHYGFSVLDFQKEN
jgi:hypothetical protein